MATEINLTPTGSFLDITFDEAVSYEHSQGTQYLPHLTGRTWGTSSECRQAALLVHGLGAHSGWFEALGRRLKVRRVFALAYDQVGFGKRRHLHFFSRHQWGTDIEVAYRYLRHLVGDKPIYLMGNSMGAVVALQAATKIKPAGLVMFSPGFDGHPQTFKTWYRIKGLLKALLEPDAEMDLPYSIDEVTGDETVRQWLTNDPERRFSLPARMFLELLRLNWMVEKNSMSVECPLLMITAGIEKIVDNKTARRIYDRLNSPSKTSRHFNEAWHDLMFDKFIDDMVDDLTHWMEETSPDRMLSQP